jgi:hypothetical protein
LTIVKEETKNYYYKIAAQYQRFLHDNKLILIS